MRHVQQKYAFLEFGCCHPKRKKVPAFYELPLQMDPDPLRDENKDFQRCIFAAHKSYADCCLKAGNNG